MKFTELNQKHESFTVRGQFESDHFGTPQYDQELHMLSEISKEFIPNPVTPDRSWGIMFNHTEGHDGRFPLMAQMRDWWGLSKRSSVTWLLTKRLGGTSTVHTDECEHRYLVFCTEWHVGQTWFIGDECYTGWHVGTVVDFDFNKTMHGNANASHQPLTFMQITTK